MQAGWRWLVREILGIQKQPSRVWLPIRQRQRDSGTFTAILEPVFERGIARMDNIPAEYFYRQGLSDYAESFGRSINLADYLRSSLPDIDY